MTTVNDNKDTRAAVINWFNLNFTNFSEEHLIFSEKRDTIKLYYHSTLTKVEGVEISTPPIPIPIHIHAIEVTKNESKVIIPAGIHLSCLGIKSAQLNYIGVHSSIRLIGLCYPLNNLTIDSLDNEASVCFLVAATTKDIVIDNLTLNIQFNYILFREKLTIKNFNYTLKEDLYYTHIGLTSYPVGKILKQFFNADALEAIHIPYQLVNFIFNNIYHFSDTNYEEFLKLIISENITDLFKHFPKDKLHLMPKQYIKVLGLDAV